MHVFLLFLSLSVGMQQAEACSERLHEAESVSIIQLVATPKLYSGKMISVIGYVTAESRRSYLFLDEGTALRGDYANSVVLGSSPKWSEFPMDVESGSGMASIDAEAINRTYRVVTGFFQFGSDGKYFTSVCNIRATNTAPPELR